MSRIKTIISLILVVVIIFTVTPRFYSEDSTKDGVVDLKDAILLVRELNNLIDNTTGLKSSLSKTIVAFHAIAEFDEIIKPSLTERLIPPTSDLLMPSFFMVDIYYLSYSVGSNRKSFPHAVHSPEVPPPKPSSA